MENSLARARDPTKWAKKQGVLTREMIKDYIGQINLIEKADDKNIEPASYDLRLGSQYYLRGKYKYLTKENPDLVIPAHEVVVISSYEELKMPLFLIGRWNIRIGLVYRGILLVSGPQVDPGFRGKLFCTLYNLSTQEIRLKYKDHVATIDFIRTAEPVKKGLVQKKSKMEDYLPPYILKSSPADMVRRVERVERRVETFVTSTYVALGIIVSALAILITVMLKGGI